MRGRLAALRAEKIFDRVVASVADIARNFVIGSGFDPATEIGPLVSEQHLKRVMKYIDIGRQEGAELVAGGEAVAGNGYFVKPTVFQQHYRPFDYTDPRGGLWPGADRAAF